MAFVGNVLEGASGRSACVVALDESWERDEVFVSPCGPKTVCQGRGEANEVRMLEPGGRRRSGKCAQEQMVICVSMKMGAAVD